MDSFTTGLQVKLEIIDFSWDDMVGEWLWIFVEDSAGFRGKHSGKQNRTTRAPISGFSEDEGIWWSVFGLHQTADG